MQDAKNDNYTGLWNYISLYSREETSSMISVSEISSECGNMIFEIIAWINRFVTKRTSR